MSDWLPTLARVLRLVRGTSDLRLPAVLQMAAKAAGEPVSAAQASRIVHGHALPTATLWRALVLSAGLEGEWGALSGELDAERARRVDAAAARRPAPKLSAADAAETRDLPAKVVAERFGCSVRTVQNARRNLK